MALYEYLCKDCNELFEQIVSGSSDSEPSSCPKCNGMKLEKLISKFTVGGHGDLRESTMHGCHEATVPLSEDGCGKPQCGNGV